MRHRKAFLQNLLKTTKSISMTPPKIFLSPPHMGGTEQEYIAQAFQENWIAPVGPQLTLFEQHLETYFEGFCVTALNSGTAAIHLGLQFLGVSKNDEVLCQSLTFVASVNPVVYLGALPVFVGSESTTGNMCPVALEAAIKNRIQNNKIPKAILVVHLYGMPAQIDRIMEIANRYQIPVVEDAAEAMGSRFKGQLCGTFGTVGVLSFNGNKIITTAGGGALLTRTHQAKEKCIFWATQAKENTPHYEHKEIGYNYRMSNIAASIGLGQLAVLEQRMQSRRKNHEVYAKMSALFPQVQLLSAPVSDFDTNYWLNVIVLNSLEQREALRLHFEKNYIESRPVWKPMHLQPLYQECLYFGTDHAADLFARGLCLPSGSALTATDFQQIQNAFALFFEKRKT